MMFFLKKDPEKNSSVLLSQTKEEQEKREIKTHNDAVDALFDAIAELPICLTLENIDCCTRGLSNVINGVILVATNEKPKRFLEMRCLPNSGNGFWVRLTFKEAEKILALWTIMSKPYYVVDWNISARAEGSASSDQTNEVMQTPNTTLLLHEEVE